MIASNSPHSGVPSPPRRRRGVVLVCVLVCLSIATTLVASSTAAILKQRRLLRSERDLRQVELLVDAGRLRGVERFRRDAAYHGETWRLAEGVMPTFGAATVRINVITRSDADTADLLVVATLEPASNQPVRRSRTYYRILKPSVPEPSSAAATEETPTSKE